MSSVKLLRNSVFVLILFMVSYNSYEMNGGLIVNALNDRCMEVQGLDHGTIGYGVCDVNNANQKLSTIKLDANRYALKNSFGSDLFPSECYRRLRKVAQSLIIEPYNDDYIRFRFANTNNCIDFTRNRQKHTCGMRIYECSRDRLGQAFSLRGGGYVRPDPNLKVRGFIKNGTNNLLISQSILVNGNLSIQFTNKTTGRVYTAKLADGSIYEIEVPKGDYTIKAQLRGFSTESDNRSITQASNESDQRNTFLLSPSFVGWRFILTWNNKVKDLDIHVVLPTREDIYWGNTRSKDGSANIDIDAQNGDGPETITYLGEHTGVVRIFVENYSKETTIVNSDAQVKIYHNDSLVQTIKAVGLPGVGSFWDVARVNVGTGELSLINKIGLTLPN